MNPVAKALDDKAREVWAAEARGRKVISAHWVAGWLAQHPREASLLAANDLLRCDTTPYATPAALGYWITVMPVDDDITSLCRALENKDSIIQDLHDQILGLKAEIQAEKAKTQVLAATPKKRRWWHRKPKVKEFTLEEAEGLIDELRLRVKATRLLSGDTES